MKTITIAAWHLGWIAWLAFTLSIIRLVGRRRLYSYTVFAMLIGWDVLTLAVAVYLYATVGVR